MRQPLVLLFIVCLNSCVGIVQKRMPTDDDAVMNFNQNKEDFQQLKELVLSDSNYKDNDTAISLLSRINCINVFKDRNGKIIVTYYEGGGPLAGIELYYLYMQNYQSSYGDSISHTSKLVDEVYRDPIQGSKIKSLDSGWYLGLSVE